MFARLLASSSRAVARATTRSYSARAAAPAAESAEVQTYGAPYFVERTTGGELPVYSAIRNGGTNVTTHVRRVRGDVNALRNDLAQYFADGHIDPLSAPPAVTIRPTSKHVVVKGRAVAEIKAWLEMRGF